MWKFSFGEKSKGRLSSLGLEQRKNRYGSTIDNHFRSKVDDLKDREKQERFGFEGKNTQY